MTRCVRLQIWLNRDPIGEKLAMNLYGFVDNDAIDRRDRNGLSAGSICAHKCDMAYVSCLFQWNSGARIAIGGLGSVLIAGGKTCSTTTIGMALATLARGIECASTMVGCLSACPPETPYPTAPPGSGCSLCPVNMPPVIYGY